MAKHQKRRELHGMTRSREHNCWAGMVQRCTNPRHPAYDRYGGAGIDICAEWRMSFAAFYAHVGPRPAGTSIDRIDNNRGYEPGNVRWATPLEQSHNSSRIKLSEDIVRDIRRRRARGETIRGISRELDLNRNNVKFVASGVTWKHVEGGDDNGQ